MKFDFLFSIFIILYTFITRGRQDRLGSKKGTWLRVARLPFVIDLCIRFCFVLLSFDESIRGDRLACWRLTLKFTAKTVQLEFRNY